MPTIHDDLLALEQHVELLNKHAATVSPKQRAEGFSILATLVQRVQANDYTRTAPSVEVGGHIEGLTFDRVQANQELAANIVTKAEETVERIDALVTAGKNFKADRAKADVHAVTTKVAGILQNTELTEAWVGEDLQKLAARADQLHGLFFPTESA